MTNKAIIWISVSVILVGAGVSAYFYFNNKPEQNEGDADTNLDNKDYSDSGSGTVSGGGSGSGSPVADTGTGIENTDTSNFDKVKKFYGSQARFMGDRIIVKKTEKDFNKNWGLGNREISIVYYTNGRFFINIETIGNNLISGNYSNGGDKLQVTSATNKWAVNKGLIVEGNALANIKQVLSV